MTALPRMALVEQEFERPQIQNIAETLTSQLEENVLNHESVQGKRIAVAVGSRGITHIGKMSKIVVNWLRDHGAEPFLIPAMGSHGGGTEEGQREILENYGITPEAIGAPLDLSLETVQFGETPEGHPVYIAKTAMESDGVILINRIKAHTDFHGDVESGMMKMIAIGLGKIEGARTFHSRTFHHEHSPLIASLGRVVMESGKILAGVMIVENAYHDPAKIVALPAPQIEEREKELLKESKKLLPAFPVQQIDALIIDYIGKNISGVGLDPNITGRYYRINARWQNENPNVTRILIRDITDETKGNAVGIGLADFCHKRVIDKMDRRITYLNAITSRNVICGGIPPYFDSDKEMLEQCMTSLQEDASAQNVRMIRIQDTLSLDRIWVAEGLLDELRPMEHIKVLSEPKEMKFDEQGNLG